MLPPSGETRSVTGAEIVLQAYDLITGDRNDSYDHPHNDYLKVAQIFEAVTGIRLTVEQAVLFPLAMKLARIRTHMERGGYHEDSVRDAIGYLGCYAMVKEVGDHGYEF